MGKAFTPFKRLLDHDYGLKGGLRTAKSGSELPSARLLSTTLARSTESFSKKPNDGIRTIFLMQMGQFIDHDLAHSPNFPDKFPDKNEDCCTLGSSLTKMERENCIPIEIPRNDEFFGKSTKSFPNGRRCLPMARALTAPNLNCEMGTREQVIPKQNITSGANSCFIKFL